MPSGPTQIPLTLTSHNNQSLFSDHYLDDILRRSSLKLFIQHIAPIVEVYAYCLLPNHFHYLLRLKQRPFRRIPVSTNAYFFNLITYIHRNPQKHGLIDDFRD